MSLAARLVQGADVLGARSGLAHTYQTSGGRGGAAWRRRWEAGDAAGSVGCDDPGWGGIAWDGSGASACAVAWAAPAGVACTEGTSV